MRLYTICTYIPARANCTEWVLFYFSLTESGSKTYQKKSGDNVVCNESIFGSIHKNRHERRLSVFFFITADVFLIIFLTKVLLIAVISIATVVVVVKPPFALQWVHGESLDTICEPQSFVLF